MRDVRREDVDSESDDCDDEAQKFGPLSRDDDNSEDHVDKPAPSRKTKHEK